MDPHLTLREMKRLAERKRENAKTESEKWAGIRAWDIAHELQKLDHDISWMEDYREVRIKTGTMRQLRIEFSQWINYVSYEDRKNHE